MIPAWQAGATGRGIKIGLVDSGIDINHHDFVGRIDPASRGFTGDGIMDVTGGHGTAVASIAAGAHDGRTVEGIAYEATLVVMNIAPSNCTNSCGYTYSNIASAIDAAAAAGARVINLSIGGAESGTVNDAVQRAAQHGVIFVVSAGNDSMAQPTGFARGIANAAPGQAIIVGGLGLEGADYHEWSGEGIDFNQLMTMSNAAGSSQDVFMGAPGRFVRVDFPGIPDGITGISGTSFAAPAVAGTVALMLQAFPTLTARDVVQILFTTADDIGTPGEDLTFGHGRLNVGRAFQPIGQATLAGSGIRASLTDNGSAPAVAGDALNKGSLNAIILDAYRRAFSLNLARTLKQAPPTRPLTAAVAANIRSSSIRAGAVGAQFQLTDGDLDRKLGFSTPSVGPRLQRDRVLGAYLVSRLGHGLSAALSFSGSSRSPLRPLSNEGPSTFLVNQDALSTPGFARVGSRTISFRKTFGRISVSVGRETGEVLNDRASEVTSEYRVSSVGLDTTAGVVHLTASIAKLAEERTVLGGRLGSVFGPSGASTTFLDGQAGVRLARGWSLYGAARRGWTAFGAGGFTASGWSFGFNKECLFDPSNAITVMVSQPLRVDGGGFALALPGSYDYQVLQPTYRQATMSLRPSGREIVTEIGFARALGTGALGFNLYARRQPGHYAAAAPDLGAAVRLRLDL